MYSNSVKFLCSQLRSCRNLSCRMLKTICKSTVSRNLPRTLANINIAPQSYSILLSKGSYSVLLKSTKYRHCDIKHIINSKQNYVSKPNQEKKSNLVNEMTKVMKEFDSLDPVIDSERTRQLKPLIQIIENINQVKSDMKSLEEINSDKSEDKEMRSLLEEEMDTYRKRLENLSEQFAEGIIQNEDQFEHCSEVMMEINAGVGGQEAMLFAQEILEMYVGYAEYRRWDRETVLLSSTESGGIRQATLHISGPNAFSYLKYEGGVHRVQRVPKTERAGRVHTSTVSVAVLPQPREIQVLIADKDLKIETKKASGAGGQHVNTTDSAVRITHLPTGIVVECQEDRSQIKNRSIAIEKLKHLIYETRFEEQENSCKLKRKIQVGRRTRNEKIRTYNFPQDRITDHRSHRTVYNVAAFMCGDASLHEMMDEIRAQDYAFRIEQLLS